MDFESMIIYFGGLPLFLLSLLLPRPKDTIMVVVGWLAVLIFMIPWLLSVAFVLIKADHWMYRRVQQAILTLDENAPLAIFWWISAFAGLFAFIFAAKKLTRIGAPNPKR